MAERKARRAAKLYELLDSSRLYIPRAKEGSRSDMNITFRTPSAALDAQFVSGAAERGLMNLKGHKATGGIRASLYNAMPMEGVDALARYMREFEKEHT